ncbi:hypothetical protein AG1IA_07411 [Rhizoctonia solani AG-1 IA]|uniref:Phytase-like domain-containing protein n=1 Tax=Thanatephorus cucumeris (strain AG1-IA) TaxID=983506 RepID=L8WP68_THACA|nr:hypothetical protein AG1IA_07411 [Rhizoctonia solani AG-1 IA]
MLSLDSSVAMAGVQDSRISAMWIFAKLVPSLARLDSTIFRQTSNNKLAPPFQQRINRAINRQHLREKLLQRLSLHTQLLPMYSIGLALPVFIGSTLAATTDPSLWTTATLGGQTFVNQGLVGFGYIPASARDSYGETLGGLGSAIALQKGTFKAGSNGTFTGRLIAQPDRGYNVETTIDWQARQHSFDFVFSPYYSKNKLDFDTAAKTFSIQYKSTLLYSKGSIYGAFALSSLTDDRLMLAPGFPTSGLDAISSIPNTSTYPVLPAPGSSSSKISVDAEGLVLNADGSFWTSDEYGPYIYRFGANGTLLQAIQPPTAILPTIGGKLNFTSSISPEFGRDANQASSDGRTLFALLQSATIQDGGGDKETNRYTRLFAWDILAQGSSPVIGMSSMYSAGASKASMLMELVPLGEQENGWYLYLRARRERHTHRSRWTRAWRRRHGSEVGLQVRPAATSTWAFTKLRLIILSSLRQADLFDISNATDIHGTKFDGTTPVAPKGKLDKNVVPATYVPFVNYLDSKQLGRFGLHNDEPTDRTLIDAKWESFALAPVLDSTTPDDYFLVTMVCCMGSADNDFITINGTALGKPYSASYGQDVDTQILVWRVTLPSVPRGSVAASLGI